MQELEVRIHSCIATHLGAGRSRFYYLLRALDPKGAGWAEIDRTSTLDFLKVSRATFFRYLQDQNLVRAYRLIHSDTGLKYRIYYRGLCDVTSRLDLDSFGAVTFVLTSDFEKILEYATLAEALKLQKQSQYIAKINAKKEGLGRKVLDLEKVFGTSSHISGGIVRKTGAKRDLLFYNPDDFAPVGGSQATIAERLGVSVRLVNDRLRDFTKVQQALGSSDTIAVWQYTKYLDEEEWTTNAQRFFRYNNPKLKSKVFKSYCNLYEGNGLELVSMKRARKKYKKLRKALEGSEKVLVGGC